MNPLTITKNQNILNERELRLGYTGTQSSWHGRYKDSAWIFIGGLNYELTEGDVICVFSQYGEVVNLNLVRDRKTGQSKGFAFLCYEDQRSTVLATDNLNGIKLAGRVIRVDHVEQYKVPKDGTLDVGLNEKKSKKRVHANEDPDMVTAFVREHGCGPEMMKQLEKIQKQQEKASRKTENKVVDHSSEELHGHRRFPVQSQYKRSSTDDREPHTEKSKHNSVNSPSKSSYRQKRDAYLSVVNRTSNSPMSGETSPLQRHRKEVSSPIHLRIASNPSSRCQEPGTCCRSDADPSPPRQKPGRDTSSALEPPRRIFHSSPSPRSRIRDSDRSPPRRRPARDARSPRRYYSIYSSPRRRLDSSYSSCRPDGSKRSPQRRHERGLFSSRQTSDFDMLATRRRSRSTSRPRRINDSNPSPPRHVRNADYSSTNSTRSLKSPSRIKQESPFDDCTCSSSHQKNGSSPHRSKW